MALKFDDSLLMFDEPKHTKNQPPFLKSKTTIFPVPKSTIFVEKEYHQIYLGWGYVSCQRTVSGMVAEKSMVRRLVTKERETQRSTHAETP